jgi:hypothetical protein
MRMVSLAGSSSPRRCIATPLFLLQHRASIGPAPHYRSSADKTAGSKSSIRILESAAGCSSNISCLPKVRSPQKPQWRLPPRLSQRVPCQAQRSVPGLLDQQRGCAMISPLRNSKGDGTGAVNVAAASGCFSSVASREPSDRRKYGYG